MSVYTYTIDESNYEQDITFNLNKDDILTIYSTRISSSKGLGLIGDSKSPNISISDINSLTGIKINSSFKILTKYFFSITINCNELNKIFKIKIFNKDGFTQFETGTININLSNEDNIKIKVNGVYIDGSPKIKINGNWTDGSTYVKINGTWRN